MNQIALCPYCSSSHTMFKYSTANAIYSTDEHGYPIGVTEDTINYYHCNNCQKDFTIKRTDEIRKVKLKLSSFSLEIVIKLKCKMFFGKEGSLQALKDVDAEKSIDKIP